MADFEIFDLVTSQEFRERLATFTLIGEKLLGEVKDGSYGRDPYLVLEDCLARGVDIPTWVGWKIIEERKRKDDKKRKQGGRHTRAEQRARQQADDAACWLAVKEGVACGLKPTPAEARAGKALHLSRQAVHDACIREENRLKGFFAYQDRSEKK
jgi:hypothetical protein